MMYSYALSYSSFGINMKYKFHLLDNEMLKTTVGDAL